MNSHSSVLEPISPNTLMPENRDIPHDSPIIIPDVILKGTSTDIPPANRNTTFNDPVSPRITGHGLPSPHQRFLILPPPSPNAFRTLHHTILLPLRLFTYPIILWAALATGFTANVSLALNITQSQVFAAPPYNFSPSQVGFANFALVAVAIVGLGLGGRVSDWWSMRRTRANEGVREPEMRLGTAGLWIWGVALGGVVSLSSFFSCWSGEVALRSEC